MLSWGFSSGGDGKDLQRDQFNTLRATGGGARGSTRSARTRKTSPSVMTCSQPVLQNKGLELCNSSHEKSPKPVCCLGGLTLHPVHHEPPRGPQQTNCTPQGSALTHVGYSTLEEPTVAVFSLHRLPWETSTQATGPLL